jgi:molybdopterin-containing oxidoreductase family iron-sulfur binding subunit
MALEEPASGKQLPGRARSLPMVDSAHAMEEAIDPNLSRRGFLRLAGFAFGAAALSGCGRAPVHEALPYLNLPPGIVPGLAYQYAAVCGACPAGCGILVKNRDGRPIKLEGNPEHPLSGGGLCAIGQASILGLYDRFRLKEPLRQGQPVAWDAVDSEVRGQLEEIRKQGKAVRVLTGAGIGPTCHQAVNNFLTRFPNARHIVHGSESASAIMDAHARTNGLRVLPHYLLEKAVVLVGIDADFLGTWIAPVQFARAYQANRNLEIEGTPPHLSFHVQFESRLSLTGSKADRRATLSPGDIGSVLTQLASRLARKAGSSFAAPQPEPSSVPVELLDDLSEQLWQARGRSLLLCGSQDISEQVLCNFINHLLGSYGTTIDLESPSYQEESDDRALAELMRELEAGQVAALILFRSNPIHDLPSSESLAEALGRVPLLVSCTERLDESAALAHFVCPVPHYLETWSDSEPVEGTIGLSQPAIAPFGETRPFIEILAAWSGRSRSAYDQIRELWESQIYPRRVAHIGFALFWDSAVHDGYVRVKPRPGRAGAFDSATVRPIVHADRPSSGEYALVLYHRVGIRSASHAYNPWLQELPDPISKVTWDNYVSLSPRGASRLDVAEGDVVRLETGDRPGSAIELPVLVQPGQHDEVVAVALGYGSKLSERFANIGPPWLGAGNVVGANGMVGSNAAPFLTWKEGTLHRNRLGVRVSKTDRRHALATTQMYPALQPPSDINPPVHRESSIIKEMTLAELVNSAQPAEKGHAVGAEEDFWPEEHPAAGHRWGMVIDLNACTGCSACVLACQVENNIPVVGKDEVRRHREMHWLRIDRYYAQHDLGLEVAHQPMLCQHCGKAPCEVVCPVLATVHSEEGLNEQVYNRCVGTRYCANNCPYKVRRFNWFDYSHDDQLQNLLLNPDVTVRSRGVMEKCSFCIQRIELARIEAHRLGRDLADGDIQTACQQSCPTQAIQFGDRNDSSSRVAERGRSRRAYHALRELNVEPSIAYLALVRNRQGNERGAHRG